MEKKIISILKDVLKIKYCNKKMPAMFQKICFIFKYNTFKIR